MIVSSPIGNLPFEPRTLHIHDRGIEIEGLMGAWPAQVRIDVTDLPALGRLLTRPAALFAGAATTVASLVYLTGPRHSTRHRRRFQPKGKLS